MPLDAISSKAMEAPDSGWLNAPSAPRLPAGEVDVWLLQLGGNGSKISNSCLSTDELARAASFRFERHREEFVSCRNTLRSLLGRYLDADPADIHISSGPNGKPYVSGALAELIEFNVSHSGDRALFAFSREEIGVDVELCDPQFIEPGTLDICLSPSERKTFDTLDIEEQTRVFFETWTAKEAYLKLAGDGLTIEPNLIDLNCSTGSLTCTTIGGRDIYFHRLPEISGYSSALASYSSIAEVRSYIFPRDNRQ